VISDDIARVLADRFWERDPLSFLGLCAECRDHGITLLDFIKQRTEELREMRKKVAA
jgi:hypothetical protein